MDLTLLISNQESRNAIHGHWFFQLDEKSIDKICKMRGDNFGAPNVWSSPRKEKNRKPPTGETVVLCEQKTRVNSNWGKQGGITKKGSLGIANPKGDLSGRQTKLVPRCPQENSNKDPSRCLKELIPRHQRKRRGIPKKEYLGIITPKYDLSGRQKEIISEVPEG